MDIVKTLQLNFRNDEGRPVTINIVNPVEPLVQQDVEDAMDLILTKNIFLTSGGNIKEKVSARLISREVTDVVVY